VARPQGAGRPTVERTQGGGPSYWLGHIGALSAARLIAPVLRMAVPVWLSRVLGVEGLGNYQLVMSYYVIYSTVASLGLLGLVVREIAALRGRGGALLLHACGLSVMASVPMGLVMGMTGVGYGGETGIAMWIMAIGLFPAGVALYAEGALLALGKAGYVAGFMVAEETVLTVLTCGLLWLQHGLVAVFVTTVVVRSVAAAIRFSVAAGLAGGVVWRIEGSTIRDMLRQAPVFFGATVLSALFWRLDLVMLSWLGTATDVGLYAAALRFVNMGQEVPAAILATIFPRLSALHGESREGFRTLFVRSAKYLSLLAIGTSVVTTLMGPAVIRLLFGSKFDASVPVLQVLIWSLLPFSLMKLLGSALIATHNQVTDLVINAVVLGVNVALKLLLIPAYGPIGAAWATVAAISLAVAMRGRFFWEQT
jgi:O-antigen/teichoic acid export membrane protein